MLVLADLFIREDPGGDNGQKKERNNYIERPPGGKVHNAAFRRAKIDRNKVIFIERIKNVFKFSPLTYRHLFFSFHQS